MSDEVTQELDAGGHPKRHKWNWAKEIPGKDPDDDLVRVGDEPGDLVCRYCNIVIPGDEYYALVALLRKNTHLSVEEHAEQFAERLELMALKYEIPDDEVSET